MSVAESPEVARRAPSEQPSVLVVEDNRRLRETLVRQLHDLGIEPSVAITGPEAVRLAGTLHPDLIILDGLLPGLHGFETARLIRHMDGAYRPRIAILTAIYTKTNYQNEARLKYGVDDYLVKPLKPSQLRELLEHAKEQS